MARLSERQWIELYTALEKKLYNAVYRWVWDAADAQDIVQEAFLRCWRIRHRVREHGVSALLYRTALRLASNQRRRRRLWQMVAFDGNEAMVPAPEVFPRPVQRAFDRLPDALKRVLVLSDVLGMSYAEIATVLGVREGTIGSRRNRALARLRKDLEAQGMKSNDD